jgi:hypothetical protein
MYLFTLIRGIVYAYAFFRRLAQIKFYVLISLVGRMTEDLMY